ncbi:restriction endonuclease [Phyllobacterium endophyticum]|uniref:Restriction endonuclease n=1 Tax=Phyllobacterium endophyticum TaxID=1149773 RepID=A0A2P7AZF1_9HYPH|nr:restriction endonuclease [Phyllobacterium endophyticum]PSH59605.1 restriction endonuclease [Phyllobacterium endophyticum]TYR42834.1 restriction endonuclease [Phyllobacterium endophyticum]
MTIPDYQSLMLTVLKAAANKAVRVPDLEDLAADEFRMNADERQQLLPSGRQRMLANRLHWAKFYLLKAGLLSTPQRGQFIATDAGRLLLASKPARIDNEQLKKYPSFQAFIAASKSSLSQRDENLPSFTEQDSHPQSPDDQIETAYASLLGALQEELLERILASSPSFFEGLIVDLLIAMGYGGSHQDAARKLGRTGDGGVDGVINEDRLGLDRIYVQAKRYQIGSAIHTPTVNAFVGSLEGFKASKGVFVTTSRFSEGARTYVRSISKSVILIDGKQLVDLMIEHNVGVRVHRTLQFKRLDEDFFSDEE